MSYCLPVNELCARQPRKQKMLSSWRNIMRQVVAFKRAGIDFSFGSAGPLSLSFSLTYAPEKLSALRIPQRTANYSLIHDRTRLFGDDVIPRLHGCITAGLPIITQSSVSGEDRGAKLERIGGRGAFHKSRDRKRDDSGTRLATARLYLRALSSALATRENSSFVNPPRYLVRLTKKQERVTETG